MAVVFACVVPHGWPTIPDLSDDAAGAMATRHGLQEVGQRCSAVQPDVIVLATPHGIRVEGAIGLASVARGAGTLFWGDKSVEMNVPVDRVFTGSVARAARARDLPVALTGFGGNSPAEAVVPLDWGTMVPLWFLGHGRNMPGYGNVLADDPTEDIGPPVVIVTPARDLPRDANVELGTAIAEAAAADGRRVAFVASCDWAHTHPGGRYGEDDAAAQVDATVVAALRDGDPGGLIDLDPAAVDAAAIDGLWQALVLAGVMKHVPMRAEVLVYEMPPSYATGMIVATFTPAG